MKTTPHDAVAIFNALGIKEDEDFHVLHSSKVDGLVTEARARGYRKSKDAPGSTARMYHAYLLRLVRKYRIEQ